jgi:ribosomal protein S18 acetylase RimI-like enzyme
LGVLPIHNARHFDSIHKAEFDLPDTSVIIRSYRASDRAACQQLYLEGLLGGRLAENDTGLDIDDIDSAYLSQKASHFWVAELPDGTIAGMIGVQQHEPGVGEIRRLRVSPANRRRGIGSALLTRALEFCRDHATLKVMLDTFMEREPALRLFEKFHFRHERTREANGKQMLLFYLDLYGGNLKL